MSRIEQAPLHDHVTHTLDVDLLVLWRGTISTELGTKLFIRMTKHRMYAHIGRSCNVPMCNELDALIYKLERQS